MINDVVIYLSSLPRIADRSRKMEVLKNFAQGVIASGVPVVLQDRPQVTPARLSVILGWIGMTIRGPHIQTRSDVIQWHRDHGGHVMAIDSSCFKFADPDSQWLRYSLDGVNYRQAFYGNRGSDGRHWDAIRRSLGIDLRPWRSSGGHVLVCLQRDGGWSMKGVNLDDWARSRVRELRQHTDRPIVVRAHPKFPVPASWFQNVPNVRMSQEPRLEQDIHDAWAAVFFNSSSCVASVLGGVPVFVDDDDCVAWDVANTRIQDIETPRMPPREQWLWDLCQAHWNDQHSITGDIYRHFGRYL